MYFFKTIQYSVREVAYYISQYEEGGPMAMVVIKDED